MKALFSKRALVYLLLAALNFSLPACGTKNSGGLEASNASNNNGLNNNDDDDFPNDDDDGDNYNGLLNHRIFPGFFSDNSGKNDNIADSKNNYGDFTNSGNIAEHDGDHYNHIDTSLLVDNIFVTPDLSLTPPALNRADTQLGNLNSVSNYSCDASQLKLRWPISGTQSVDWATWSYFDRDQTSGKEDYMGYTGNVSKAFDGSQGLSLALSSFRQMDQGRPVLAAAAGKVIAVKANYADRNYGAFKIGCASSNNHVVIRHANGYTTSYNHLKNGSVLVSVNDTVSAGQVIAAVGSSGCSSHPHLYFEVRNCQQERLDASALGMWLNSPTYNAPRSFMDVYVKQGAFDSVTLANPPANAASLSKWNTLGVAFSFTGAQHGDLVRVEVLHPNGSIHDHWEVTFDDNLMIYQTLSLWTFSTNLSGAPAGNWAIRFLVNGSLKRTHLFQVTN